MNLKQKTFNYWIRCYLYNNKYILFLQRRRSHLSDMILLLSLPYLLLRWGILVFMENLYGKYRIKREMGKEQNLNFVHELAMVSISKNEGPYIREWIEYHKLMGFTKFYFYDNESEDDTKSILQPYIENRLVEYVFIPGKARQLDAYNDAIRRHKSECHWMAFLDMDEYLMPTIPFQSVAEVLSSIVQQAGKGACGVGINWAVYGSSHFEKKPKGLTIENFVYRSLNNHWANYHVKTICNPRMVVDYVSPHYPIYKIGGYSVNESDGKRQYGWFCHKVQYQHLRINHYFTKSKEQYIQKCSRGLGDRVGKYEMEKFNQLNLNDVYDDSMLIYARQLKGIDLLKS